MFSSFRAHAVCASILAIACVISFSKAASQVPSGAYSVPVPAADELVKRIKPQHPRLLIDAAGFKGLQKKIAASPVLRQWDAELQTQADRCLREGLPEHVMPDGLRLLDTSRRMVHHSYTLALAYRLHGDRRYRDRLWKDMETVARFPDFNPRHFLDTAEMTLALGIAYDWLYDRWTPTQRETIRSAMVRMGLRPGMKVYDSGRGWARFVHNWNQVCNGGMTVGALAIGDEEPELCGQVLHNALSSVQLAMRSYAPDGGWGEGPGYWAYATSYNVTMIACLESALGSNFGLDKFPGFSETGLFPLYMAAGDGRSFNFSDASEGAGRGDCSLWLGNRFHEPAVTWFGAGGRPSAAAMIWYQSPGEDPAAAGLPLDKYFRNVEVATFRSRWNDPQAVFAGIEARSHAVNHEHLDIGSFVLDALGERWATDLGADNYNLPGYFGRQRYDYYRLRAEGHNTLVIGPASGPDQDPEARCRIRRFESKRDWAFAIADLTSAYAGRAKKVERGVVLVNRQTVVVQDEIEGANGEIWWFMHTRAAVKPENGGKGALLTINGKQLEARIVSPSSARFRGPRGRAALQLAKSTGTEKQRRCAQASDPLAFRQCALECGICAAERRTREADAQVWANERLVGVAKRRAARPAGNGVSFAARYNCMLGVFNGGGKMGQSTLEERVSVLENTVAGLVAGAGRLNSDWKSTVGMFEGDAVMAEIQEEGRKIREAERRAAQQESEP